MRNIYKSQFIFLYYCAFVLLIFLLTILPEPVHGPIDPHWAIPKNSTELTKPNNQ